MISLTPCGEEHRWLLHQWRNLDHVRFQMTESAVIPADVHDRWYSALLTSSTRRGWVVCDDGQLCGAVFIAAIDGIHNRGSLGMYLADGGGRGRGAAALYLVMEQAFDVLGLHRLTCEVISSNTVAKKLYRGFGFQAEGTLRDHLKRESGYVDLDLFAVLADQWPGIRANAHERLTRKGMIR